MTDTPSEARERADATLRTLYATVTDWDRALIIQAVKAIGADGRPFSMNTIRDLLPDIAHNAAGLVFHSLIHRRNPRYLIVVGEEPSTLPNTHGKPIKVYVLAQHAAGETATEVAA